MKSQGVHQHFSILVVKSLKSLESLSDSANDWIPLMESLPYHCHITRITSDFENRYWPEITSHLAVIWQWFGSDLYFPHFAIPQSLSDLRMSDFHILKLLNQWFGSDSAVIWQWLEWFSWYFHAFEWFGSDLAVIPRTLCKSLNKITRGGGVI